MFEISLKNVKNLAWDLNITIFDAAKRARIFLDTLLTEGDEFTTYDWKTIFENMYKPAFVFDGRNILDIKRLTEIGFQAKGIGK